jgi:hypothetical protein
MQLTPPKVGKWSPPGLPKTQKTIWGVKSPCLVALFISMKSSWSVDAQNGLALTIWTSAAQVMGKRRAESQIVSLTPITKSQESTSFRCHLKECDTALESSRWELQLWFRPRPDPSSGRGAMSVQSLGTLTWDNFGTPTWESREKEPFGCSLGRELQRILYGGRWWLPWVRAVVSIVCKSARGLSQHPRVFLNVN